MVITVQVSRHPFLTSRELSYAGNFNLWRTCTDVLYLISPLLVYVLLILLLLLLLLVHQFAGLCSQQKQMGNICPGRPGLPPGPRVGICPQLSLPPSPLPGGSSSTVLRQAFFRDCRFQRGPEQLREGRARVHAPGASEEARQRGDLSLPGPPAKPGPSLTRLCYCRLQSKEVLLLLVIKLHTQDWKMKNRFVFTFL